VNSVSNAAANFASWVTQQVSQTGGGLVELGGEVRRGGGEGGGGPMDAVYRGRRTVGVGVDTQQAARWPTRITFLPNMEVAPMWSAWEWEYTRCVTLEGLPLTGHFLDSRQQVVPEGGRGVDEYDVVSCGEEHGLVVGVGYPVQVALDLPTK
jgi:hypothetical protein